jgi:hypothetical protein
MSLINTDWYVVGPPWGDGTWINAGSADPHGGTFVMDCHETFTGAPRTKAEAAELADHIVKLHQIYIEARRKRGNKNASTRERSDLSRL